MPQDDAYHGPINGYKDPTTLSVDGYGINLILVYNFSSYALPFTTMMDEDDNWMKGFFLLVPSSEKEDPRLIHGNLMREPSHSQ